MKLRVLLFFALFFSPFAVFSMSQSAAFQACAAAMPQYAGNRCATTCSMDWNGGSFVILFNGAWKNNCYVQIWPVDSIPTSCPAGQHLDTSNSSATFNQCIGQATFCTPPAYIDIVPTSATAGQCILSTTPADCQEHGNSWCSLTSTCLVSGGICTCGVNQVLSSNGLSCVSAPVVCNPGMINDPSNSQNCIPATPVVCNAPLVRDAVVTSSTYNTCVTPSPVVCTASGTVADTNLNSPTYNTCIQTPRPAYCGSGFQWNGVDCSLTTTKTATVTPPPSSTNPAPTPSPAPTAATTQTTSSANPDGTITTTTTVTNADGSKTITATISPQAGTSPNIQGTGACNAGDSCNQSQIKSSLNSIDASSKSMDSTLKSIDVTDKSILQKITDFFNVDSSAVGAANSAGDAAANQTGQAAVNGMNTNNDFFSGALLNQASDWLPALPSSGACYGTLDLVIDSHWGSVEYHDSPCSRLADFRSMLYWLFYVYTALAVVRIAFSSGGV